MQSLPVTGFVRLPVVLAHVPFARSTLWAKVKSGDFPAPIKFSKRISAWRVADIHHWIEAHSEGAIKQQENRVPWWPNP